MALLPVLFVSRSPRIRFIRFWMEDENSSSRRVELYEVVGIRRAGCLAAAALMTVVDGEYSPGW